jgi:DNA-binding protein
MTVKYFEDYIKERVVKTHHPDISRANYLIEETKKSYISLNLFIKNIKIDNNTANTSIKLCYDILHELIRAIMLKKGFSSIGNGAHEAEVSYLRKIGFKEKDIQFVDQLRYSRNSITYYGKILDKEYAQIVYEFLIKNYSILLKIAEK